MIKSAKANAEQGTISNRILPGTKITGDIQSSGDLRVDGEIIGNLQLEGKLVIGEQGMVQGDIRCAHATISGKHKGKAEISEHLSLTATAKVQGEVVTAKLSIEAGAEFTGTCNMGAVLRQIQNNGNTTKEEGRSEKVS